MASGTISLTRTGSGYLTGQISWSSVSNGAEANTSTVTATLQIQRSALNTTTGTFTGTFTVGSVSESISWYGSLPSNTWVSIKTITATVNHNADGNGSCYLYALVNGPTQTTMEGTYVSGSSTVTLEWIPRFASLVAMSNFTDEEKPVITYSNPAASAVSSLQMCLSLDGTNAKIGYRDVSKTGTSYTFDLSENERNTLRAATPNSNTLKVYVLLKSVIGSSSKVVSTTATMRIVNANPTISPNVVDTNSFTVGLTGFDSVLVPLHSVAKITINAAAKKYATIVSQKVEHGTKTLTGNGTFSPVTNNPIKFTVTDSRGNTTTQYADNMILPYFNPTCFIGNDMPEADGSFRLSVSGKFYNGYFGKNLTVQYRYKITGGSYGGWTSIGCTISGNDYTATANLTGLDYQTSYTFQARAIDPVNPSGIYSAEKSVIAKPVFDWGQNDFRFNVPVSMAGNKITNLGNPIDSADAVPYGYVKDKFAPAGYIDNYFECGADAALDTFLTNQLSAMGIMTTKRFMIAITTSTCTLPNDVWFVELIKHSTAGKAIFRSTSYRVGRYYNGTSWGAYVWDNPPMVLNVEYLTSEKHEGKSVYAKLVKFGTLPNNAEKNVSVLTAGIKVIAWNGFAVGTYRLPVPGYRGISSVGNNVGAGSMWVTTNMDMSDYTAYFAFKYYKD